MCIKTPNFSVHVMHRGENVKISENLNTVSKYVIVENVSFFNYRILEKITIDVMKTIPVTSLLHEILCYMKFRRIHCVVVYIFVFSLRPFSVQKVIQTNLILVAVNSLCPCESKKVDTEPVEEQHNETAYCNRLLLQHYRKRPQSCFHYHPDVSMTLNIHWYFSKGNPM